jgi:Dak1 domain
VSVGRLADGEMELGLGIHGEPGVAKAPLQTTDALVKQASKPLNFLPGYKNKMKKQFSCRLRGIRNFLAGGKMNFLPTRSKKNELLAGC